MTNEFNPPFPVIKQPFSLNNAVSMRRIKALALAFGLSIIPALGIGATSYHFINEAVTQRISERQSSESSISPVFQRELLLKLVLASSVTALLVSAIALLAYRLSSSKLPSQKALLFGDIASQSHPLDLDYLYKRVVDGAREVLQTDRVIIYTFDSNWNGTIVAESVAPEWPASLGNQIVDTCMQDSKGGLYRNGRICVINDIDQAGFSDCHLKVLEKYQIKANMVVPLLKDDQLLGLIIAHQCDQPRVWKQNDIDFFVQLAAIISLRLSQQNFLEQRAKAGQARLFSDVALRIRQSLDREAIFNTATKEIRQVLNVDRVLVCHLDPSQKNGTIVAESVSPGWQEMSGLRLQDIPAAGEHYIKDYKNGYIHVVNTALKETNSTHSEQYQIKASLTAPICVDNQVIGLIIAHQCSTARTWEQPTIDLLRDLAVQVSSALEQATLLKSVATAHQQTQLLADFTNHIRQSLSSQDIFSCSVEEIQKTLEIDRVLIYRFYPDAMGGEITSQSVAPDWSPAEEKIINQLFKQENFQGDKIGSLWVAHSIYEADLTPAHAKLLKRLQIQASMVAPILTDGNLVGLLCAHQCSGPRDWQSSEFYLFKQLAAQIGFALDQANLIEQVKLVSQQRQQRTEELRHQLINLLNEVEGATKGDLTVRADVTEGEIGTVADFFNAVIESLREIVTQVKQTTTQVNTSLSQNEGEIRQLAGLAFKQAEETTRTLDSVEQMTRSIQKVAESANHAASVASNASATAQTGTEAMERTVEKILSLQDTVADTVKKVERLDESSQQISRVVALINEIALQTNLLAINAGIEARRAGEEGKGFAVVAQEIGDLATNSAQATKEIEEIVETIQLETSQVFEAMQLSVIQVVEGTHLVEATKKSLGRILTVSHQIDELVESISVATVSQAETSCAVTELMKEIAQVSEQTSKASHHISDSLQQTVAVAHQLQASVEVFKVDSNNPPTINLSESNTDWS